MTSRIKRPRDPIQLAKLVGDIATGQATEPEETARSKASRLGGLKGGVARKKALTAQQRSEIARAAAAARWRGKKN
ncbi:MAG: histone H1 [Casimicrobiaceae bacterium]